MNKLKLASEIVKICKYFEVMEMNINNVLIAEQILDKLDDIIFVETLLNIFYRKIKLKKFNNVINRERIKDILIKLEIIRSNLEIESSSQNVLVKKLTK